MRIALHTNRSVAAKATGHADSFAHKTGGITRGGLGGHAEHALDGRRDAQAEACEEGSQSSAGDKGHDDHEEDLPGVALGPVDEIAEETLELLVGLLDEALTRGAFVVRRAIVSKEAGAAAVAASESKE